MHNDLCATLLRSKPNISEKDRQSMTERLLALQRHATRSRVGQHTGNPAPGAPALQTAGRLALRYHVCAGHCVYWHLCMQCNEERQQDCKIMSDQCFEISLWAVPCRGARYLAWQMARRSHQPTPSAKASSGQCCRGHALAAAPPRLASRSG